MTEVKRPAKGTPEYELWLKAIDIALAAPWRQGQHVGGAKIPWGDIHELRKILEALGIDWQKAKRKDDEQRRALHPHGPKPPTRKQLIQFLTERNALPEYPDIHSTGYLADLVDHITSTEASA